MKRAIGIVRVSRTGGREGDRFHSPEIQRERIKVDCERWGLELVDTHEELDVSGGKPLSKRHVLRAALQVVERGQAEAIVFAYRDRVDRSIETGSELIRRMDAAGGLLLAGGQQITHATHDGWRHATLESFLNEDQRRAISAKLVDVHARAVDAGKAPFQTPTGYRRRQDGVCEPDPVTGPLVREAFELRAAGRSNPEIVRLLAAKGLPLSLGGLQNILRRRFYLGELAYRGHVNPEAHEPLVERELFEAVQARKGAERGRRPVSTSLLGRLGVVRCASCGARMATSKKNGGRSFYRCRNPLCEAKATVMARIAEGVVVDYVRQAIAHLEGRASSTSRVAEAQGELDVAQRAYAGAVAAFTGLDGPEATERLRELREARDAAQRAYDEAMAEASAVRVVNGSKDWGLLTREEQRTIIRAVVERVDVQRGGKGAERLSIVGRVL